MTTAQEKLQAFESFKKLGTLLPGLFETLEEWARIGSVQEAADRETAESARRVAAANSLEEQSKLEREEAHRRKIEERRAELVKLAAELALQKVTAARELETFTSQRERMAAMATAQVESAASKLAEIKTEHADWLTKVEQAKQQHAAAVAALADKQSEHDRINNVLADARARLGI